MSARDRWLLLALFLVALGLRLAAASSMLYWEDDLGTINEAHRIGSLPAFLKAPRYDWHPPLSFVFAKAWMGLCGLAGRPGEELAMRFPFCAVASLSAPLAWALARRFGLGRVPAVGVGLATAAAPLLLWIDRDIRGYALLTPLVLAAHLFLARALGDGSWRNWCAWAVFVALAMWTHYAAIPAGAAQGLYALVRLRGRSLRPVVAGALAVILYVPWLPSLVEHVTTRPLGQHAAEVQLHVPPVALTSPAYALFGLVLGHTTFPWRFEVVVPVGLACGVLVLLAAIRARREGAWTPLLFGVALVVALAAASPLRMPRYHAASCPLLLIALAQGAEELASRRRPLALVFAALVALGIARSDANLALGREYHFLYPLRPWRAAVAAAGGAPASCPSGREVFEHYGGCLGEAGPRRLEFLPDPDAAERERWTGRAAPRHAVVLFTR